MRQLTSDVLALIDYKPGWSIKANPLCGHNGTYWYLQVTLPPDEDGKVWKGRKWLLSDHMTEGEIVQTALMACLAAEEHEAREAFKYQGRALFGPHLTMQGLLRAADCVEGRAEHA